jgi:hypothetical protein
MGKKFISKKGFIGPIGDDLPSLVPIVVSLVLFFSIFALTLNTYNTKNTYLRKQMDMTSVAREIKGDSLILGIDQFETKCASVKTKFLPYNFMTGLYSADNPLSGTKKDFVDASFNQDNLTSLGFLNADNNFGELKPFFCEYAKPGAKAFTGKEKNYLVRYYPVAIQKEVEIDGRGQFIVVPGIMAMVVWE